MRFWLLGGLLAALLFIPFASAQSATDRTAAISGVVKGVGDSPSVVYLESTDDNPTRYYDGYQVAAEKNGSFSFSEIKPGTYQLRAEAFGFMSAAPSGHETEITLRPNEKRKGVTIAMVRRRAICGRVTENGKPKQTWMNAFRYDTEFGTLSDTSPPSTEADGSFWISDLDPGTYYLRAYMTWYPGSYSFNGASPINVGPDPAPAKCIFDIPLQYTGCHGTKVTGQISISPTSDDTRYRVNFLERNPSGGTMPTVMAMNLTGPYKAGDSFSGTVCPGDYDVVLSEQQGNVIFDSQRVNVGQTEIDGLVLTTRPMASIRGEVHFEDITRYASCPGLGGQHVDILRQGDGQFESATIDNKNRFEFHNVAPGDYSISLGPFLREAVYVKSITVAGKPIEGRRFSIAQPAPATIEVTLSGDLAHASGHISPDLRHEKRWEVAWTRPKGSVSGKVQGDVEGGYTVKLLSARFNSNASGEYSTHTLTDGTFHFDSVDPGVYTLRAESGNSLKYEYGSRQAGQRGTPIVVTRGAHLKDLTLFPPKLGAICGRVTDAAGTPRSALRIFVETFENGQLVDKSCGNIYLGHESEATQTDSTGRFRADKLPPGEYFFAFPYGYFSTFFSSDGSLSAATPLQLPVGKDLGCGAESPIELRVPAVINQGHTIAGQVVGDLPRSVGTAFGCPSRGTCAALEATRGQQLRNWTTLTSSTLITCRTDDSCSNFTARTVQNQ
jgi:protocatechuate 3,4-dioxygenase beta subunit